MYFSNFGGNDTDIPKETTEKKDKKVKAIKKGKKNAFCKFLENMSKTTIIQSNTHTRTRKKKKKNH